MITQVAGATNDNLLKAIMMVTFATGAQWGGVLGEKGGTAWVNLMLTLPFVLLLGYAGQLADRQSKSRVVVATRIAEVPIAFLAFFGFYFSSPWVVIVAFILLASESAFFSPSKYGVIYEYVGKPQLSRANGLISGSTNVAIIAGTGLGGYFFEWWPNWVGLVLVAMALVGLGSSLMMSYVPPVNPELKWTWNPFSGYIHGIRSMRATAKDSHGRSTLWAAVLIWAAFFMVAIVVLAIVPEYQAPLHLSTGETSLLLAALGVGLVIGCLGVALISGKRIHPWFVPIGALGMGAVMFALGTLPASEKTSPLWLLLVGLIIAGIFGGFFLVPLQAIQQALAVSGDRARVLGTANALSFLAMAIASYLYLMAVKNIPVHPSRFLLVCGVGMGLLALWTLTGGRSIFTVERGGSSIQMPQEDVV